MKKSFRNVLLGMFIVMLSIFVGESQKVYAAKKAEQKEKVIDGIEWVYVVDDTNENAEVTIIYGRGGKKKVEIPSEIDGYPVTRIDLEYFAPSWMARRVVTDTNGVVQEVIIPDTVKTMSDDIFSDMENLKQVKLPKGLKTLPESCFYNCKSLKKITLPEGIETIGGSNSGAFQGSGIEEIVLPDSVTFLGNQTFYRTPLKKITLSKNLKQIEDSCFSNTQLNFIELPSSLEKIGHYAFNSSSLRRVLCNSENFSIGRSIFGSDPNVIVYGKSGTSLDDYADVTEGISFISLGDDMIPSLDITVPTKTKYTEGESLSFKGMKVYLAYKNGVKIEVQDYKIVSDIDQQKLGTQDITVKRGALEKEFGITLYPKLSTPVITSVKKKGTDTVWLQWDPVPYATEYKVYHKEEGGVYEFCTVKGTTAEVYSYFSGETAKICVAAILKDGTYIQQSSKSAYTNFMLPYFTTVKNVKVKITYPDKAKVYWSKVNGAKYYTVYRSTKPNSGYKPYKDVKKNYLNLNNLPSGKTYYYKICANGSSDGAYCSKLSSSVKLKVPTHYKGIWQKESKTKIWAVEVTSQTKTKIKFKLHVWYISGKKVKHEQSKTVTAKIKKNKVNFQYKVKGKKKGSGYLQLKGKKIYVSIKAKGGSKMSVKGYFK